MLDSAAFRIPVARDAKGRIVPPEEATKGRRYTCPACGGRVHLHAGDRKRRHYHHAAGACAAETVLHLSAKELVAQAVADWRAGGLAPAFLRRCAHDGCEASTRQTMPKKILRAAVEHPSPSGYVVDVALLGPADLPVAGVEILVTHAVDDRKALELGVPWIEVDAAQVCAAAGRELVPLRDRFLPWLCPAHAETRGEVFRAERAARRKLALLTRALPWSLDAFPGYRVEGASTCPRGHESLVFTWDGREPPWPRPPHVVAVADDTDPLYDATRKGLRRVLAFRRRWTSACVTCGEPIRVRD